MKAFLIYAADFMACAKTQPGFLTYSEFKPLLQSQCTSIVTEADFAKFFADMHPDASARVTLAQ